MGRVPRLSPSVQAGWAAVAQQLRVLCFGRRRPSDVPQGGHSCQGGQSPAGVEAGSLPTFVGRHRVHA